ncbi:MAG: hypothetical protein ABMA13_16985 [Chthoniobacteraceae bacterium]
MISPGNLWGQLRRDVKRGWGAAYHDYNTLPLIEDWSWSFWGEEPATVPVHILTGEKDWRLAAWALASFFHYTEIAWPVVIHDDGTLPEEGREMLGTLFNSCRIIPREESDADVGRVLRPFPFCFDFRNTHPLALKVFDMAHYAQGDRFIVLDSDMLFFRRPQEIIDWAQSAPAKDCWFIEDAQENALITAGEVREELDVKMWSRVNSGLGLVHRPAMDFDFCDRALALTSILRGQVWRLEQTLLALCASRNARGGLLPKTYEVSLRRHATKDTVARHYVGAVRDRFYAEGLKRLRGELLPLEDE